jgi:hypothetical protein
MMNVSGHSFLKTAFVIYRAAHPIENSSRVPPQLGSCNHFFVGLLARKFSRKPTRLFVQVSGIRKIVHFKIFPEKLQNSRPFQGL